VSLTRQNPGKIAYLQSENATRNNNTTECIEISQRLSVDATKVSRTVG